MAVLLFYAVSIRLCGAETCWALTASLDLEQIMDPARQQMDREKIRNKSRFERTPRAGNGTLLFFFFSFFGCFSQAASKQALGMVQLLKCLPLLLGSMLAGEL